MSASTAGASDDAQFAVANVEILAGHVVALFVACDKRHAGLFRHTPETGARIEFPEIHVIDYRIELQVRRPLAEMKERGVRYLYEGNGMKQIDVVR